MSDITTILDELSILCPPRDDKHKPSDIIRHKIAGYFAAVLDKPRSAIKKELPTIMASWGKVRIADGGDTIRTAATEMKNSFGRNSSYVRVCDSYYYTASGQDINNSL
jgi:hypothetical protein